MQELSPYFINRSNPELTPNFSTPDKAFAEAEPSFREYCRIVGKRWRLITTLLLCTLALTSLVVFMMPPTYTASSTVLIESRAPQVLGITELETEAPSELADDNYYGTEYKILQSRSLAARVIRKLHLQNEPFLRAGENNTLESASSPHNEHFKDSRLATRLISKLRLLIKHFIPTRESKPLNTKNAKFSADNVPSKDPAATTGSDEDPGAGTFGVNSHIIDAYLTHLAIRSDPGTRLVTVAFGSPDPVLSARIVNAHVQAYIARGTELHAEASESAEKYLRTKLTELQARVERSEAELNNYRRKRGIVADSSDDNDKVVIGRLVDLNKALTDAETQRITLDAEAHLIATRDYGALPAVTNDALIQTLRQQQERIQAEYASMADQYKPNYPPLAELGAQLKETQGRINEEIHRVATGVGLSYAAAVARENELKQKIDEEKDAALALNDASLRDAILARAVDTNRKLYKNVLERMTQMGMAAGVSASNVSVLDNATPPLEPSSPKKLLTLTACGALALLIGISSACFLERFDEAFKDANDLEHYLGVPSLALVPDFRRLNGATYGEKKHRLSRFASARGKAKYTMIVAAQDNRFSAATEAYRALRLSLLLSRPGKPPKVILITSGAPNEGKTVTAINTAIAFAQMGSKVLVIDGDLRSSRCHELLEIANPYGLTELLTGRRRLDEVTRPTLVEGLACITAGSRPPNPGMLLGSSTMTDLLSVLKDRYDCILIDSAPIIPVTDTLHLMTMVDSVVLVIGPGIPRQRVRQVCARLAQIHAPLLGIVQNRVDISMHRSASCYYYPRHHNLGDMNGAGNDIEG